MIGHLNGKLVEKNPTELIVECGGVGYEVKISLNTFSALGSDEAIKIFTKLVVREDAHILYGFASKEEREMLEKLLDSTVSPTRLAAVLKTHGHAASHSTIYRHRTKVCTCITLQ